jgi:hypothetical protein
VNKRVLKIDVRLLHGHQFFVGAQPCLRNYGNHILKVTRGAHFDQLLFACRDVVGLARGFTYGSWKFNRAAGILRQAVKPDGNVQDPPENTEFLMDGCRFHSSPALEPLLCVAPPAFRQSPPQVLFDGLRDYIQ